MIYKKHCVGSFDAGIDLSEALGESSDFLRVTFLPKVAVAALGQFLVLGEFSCVGIEGIAMQCPVIWNGVEVGS